MKTSQKNKIWLWTAVDHFKQGILAWVVGDHSAETFPPLWAIVALWQCYFYGTDGWSVYPGFIPDRDQFDCTCPCLIHPLNQQHPKMSATLARD